MGLLNWLLGSNEKSVKAKSSVTMKGSAVSTNDSMKVTNSSVSSVKPQPQGEPVELGVRQKIEIAESLDSSTKCAVADAWVKVFEKLFPSPKGSVNQLFVLCMQVATAWLVMQWYDLSHKKRSSQIMGWYEMATRSKLIPRLRSDMCSYSLEIQSDSEKLATGIELIKIKTALYAKWIHVVVGKQGVSINTELIKSELEKARDFVQFWYDEKLIKLIKEQQTWDATVPRQLPAGAQELVWMNNCKAQIAMAKW